MGRRRERALRCLTDHSLDRLFLGGFFFFFVLFFFKFSYLSVGESVESEQLILSKCRERNVRDLTSDCVVCMRV